MSGVDDTRNGASDCTRDQSSSGGLASRITTAFMRCELNLSQRRGAPAQGWAGVPEVAAARAIEAAAASPSEVRRFITFCAAMDRARDADLLWASAARLFVSQRWCFDSAAVVAASFTDLADALRRSKVSQRHGLDTAAWRLIGESLADRRVAPTIHDAIDHGAGDAGELLAALQATTPAGTARFPMLAGPKIGPMWVRMLVVPGGAVIGSIDVLPVAVDVQVRKLTEYLGVTDTRGQDLEAIRPVIQGAWRRDVQAGGALGPAPLQGTCAALDPALWYLGKWGCTHCERARKRVPVHEICAACRFDQVVPA